MSGKGTTASDTLTDTRLNGLAYLYNQGAIGSGADADDGRSELRQLVLRLYGLYGCCRKGRRRSARSPTRASLR